MSHLHSYQGFTHAISHGVPPLLHQPWLEHGSNVRQAYIPHSSAPTKLSDLTHSYGQNITVLSRQPTDSKVSALAKELRSCYRSHGQIMTITSRTPTDDSRLHRRITNGTTALPKKALPRVLPQKGIQLTPHHPMKS